MLDHKRSEKVIVIMFIMFILFFSGYIITTRKKWSNLTLNLNLLMTSSWYLVGTFTKLFFVVFILILDNLIQN